MFNKICVYLSVFVLINHFLKRRFSLSVETALVSQVERKKNKTLKKKMSFISGMVDKLTGSSKPDEQQTQSEQADSSSNLSNKKKTKHVKHSVAGKTVPRPVEEPTDETKQKKKHRFRPGTVALREIKKYQRSNDSLFPKKAINQLIREIAQGLNNPSNPEKYQYRFQESAIRILHEAAEAFVVNQMENTQLHAYSAGRKEISVQDFRFARDFMKPFNYIANRDYQDFMKRNPGKRKSVKSY